MKPCQLKTIQQQHVILNWHDRGKDRVILFQGIRNQSAIWKMERNGQQVRPGLEEGRSVCLSVRSSQCLYVRLSDLFLLGSLSVRLYDFREASQVG